MCEKNCTARGDGRTEQHISIHVYIHAYICTNIEERHADERGSRDVDGRRVKKKSGVRTKRNIDEDTRKIGSRHQPDQVVA